ncbi:3-hydroxyisobutyrate dehydrogenase family protein [Pseudomonas chlororaphis subsp. aurantiaca]|jgi:3-hydroxyisobutyrate dehydrogenase|uniref:NAD(P)-dependent oxidoreductase n=1 Tax=Pseudomonas TaxID=286 RepID=UPI0006A58C6B|nr:MULTISPECIES: NAD(P)-dependent oxidoreductase [Pseudomonas]AZD20652.1 3-hydroxyisobutyrate dehydrogenase family protein [Pseudomonas chlororaphis subsp. aurantiaca]AZD34110.1 3-hydroxyisobutyrate dehydrogenase family protein [Pseudomonas chlororaphis subsp. aurantiaca]AZD40444.1 3-hydroxyisobutyrate dehydrogenase family protein [Pseudomonas chlororaphis subsp. aurantiaca]AZD65237.1 3-hydroxyisobutyrate dehydrogenase family protein [Pseudomonas chlororaphis subsp. aurantiaca]AZD71712.1 3-hyd
MMATLPTLGFAGIGLMGLPMCRRLLAAGYPLVVWNRNREKCAPLLEAGARLAETPARLCEAADLVLLCLANTEVVREVVFGAEGIAQGARAGQLLVDLSSLEPTATREMAAQLASTTGMGWVDAPVSGGTPGAEAGSLAIMVGGEAADIERVRPVLLNLGQRVTHMGGVGAGQVTKACNQMIVACNALVIAEVVALAERSGVDASLLAEALAGGFADSRPLQILAPQMAESRFEPIKWHVRTLLKDLDGAVKFSREQGSATPISGLAAQLMRLHGGQGYLEQDPATLVRLYREPASEG